MSDITEMIETKFDEPLTPEMIAETVGVRVSLVILLVKHGLLETVDDHVEEPILLPRGAVLRLRKMQRLRRDLRVNFAGAGVILEMVERMTALRREMAEIKVRYNL